MWNEGIKTFIAGAALEARRRVKIASGTVTTPPQVVYADAGEVAIGITEYTVKAADPVAVRLNNHPGTFEVTAASPVTIARGTVLYGANDGKVSHTAAGSAIGIAMQVAAANEILEMAAWNVKSTTAATVSLLDAAGLTPAATVEAAIEEIFKHILSEKQFIGVPLTALIEGDGTNTVGFLGPATTPKLDLANGDTDAALVVTWAATNVDPVLFQVALPPNLDVSEDIVVHLRAKMSGAANTPVISADCHFNEGGAKIEADTAALSAAVQNLTITIDAADVPAGAKVLTVELTPGAHATDAIVLSMLGVTYTGVALDKA